MATNLAKSFETVDITETSSRNKMVEIRDENPKDVQQQKRWD